MNHWFKTFLVLILLVGGSGSLSGCQAITLLIEAFTKKQMPRPPEEGLMLIDPIDARELAYTLQWATDLGVPEDETFDHVAVLGDLVVAVESPSNIVSVISMRDGSLLWRHVIGKVADKLHEPVRSGDLLLINSEQLLYTVNIHTGQAVGASKLESLVSHAPAVVDDVAIFGGLNHRVFAHTISAGYTKWSYQMTDRVFARPAAFGPNVFVADGQGVYAMFTAATGTLLWKGRTFDRISAQPAVEHLGVFVAGEDHSLYALDGVTGRDRWIYHSIQPLTFSPSVFTDTVILAEPGRGLVALNTRSGAERWRLNYIAKPILQFENTVMAHTQDSIVVLDLGTGKVLKEVPVHPIKGVLLGPDRRLVLASHGGRLLLLVPER